jgi:UDP-N-acetyl-D-mannosaminuronate dehydrogenase
MTDFKNHLISTRNVSVWGIGYLGYTWLLRLQSKGFQTDVYDFNSQRLEALMSGEYPTRKQKETWSSKGEMPSLELSKIKVTSELKEMFRNNLHIICFPGKVEKRNGNRLVNIAEIFKSHQDELKDGLVIFQSGETPGDIQRHLIGPLKASGVGCSFATAFRTDWSIEEFFYGNKRQVISGFDTKALSKIKDVFELFDIKHATLSTIKEAEIFESARKSLQYIVSSFINQLMLAYPDTDIRQMAEFIKDEIQFDDTAPSIGPIGYKSASAIGHLLDGSQYPDRLTMLRDTEVAGLSTIINYSEIIKRQSNHSVSILGISEKRDQRDIRLSASLIMAERLLDRGVKVKLHDPYFTKEEIKEFLPGAEVICDLKHPLNTECCVMMTPHRAYRYLNQAELDRLGVTSAKFVIDNAGLWKDFMFSEDSFYHIPGDGKLGRLEK